MEELEDAYVVTILSTLVLSLLESIRHNIPEHKKKARAVKKVEEAIRELAQLNYMPLTEELVGVGANMWNVLLEELQYNLENLAAPE